MVTMKEFLKTINFPYSQVRNNQDQFIKEVYQNLKISKNLMISAPTGLGKTISAIAPALYIAKEKKMSLICLTSRQTQTNQIIRTIRDIANKMKENNSEKNINLVAFNGKRNMCIHPQRDLYPAQDFNEFCKKSKEKGQCKFYSNTKNEDFEETIKEINKLSSEQFLDVEEYADLCYSNSLCPYELAAKKAYMADVIICDYNYVFAQGIKESFFGKIGRDINESILVVDEAHNLADRIRSSYSQNLSTHAIDLGIKELKEFVKSTQYDNYLINLKQTLEDFYIQKILGNETECLLPQEEFLNKYLEKFAGTTTLEDITKKLYDIEALVKEERVISHLGRIANFLEKWANYDTDNFTRILQKSIQKDQTILNAKILCLDPSQVASETLNNSYGSILMSATLTPLTMHKDILGLRNTKLLEFDSPFPSKNQLTLVINDVTTKYSNRSKDMYQSIAKHIENVLTIRTTKNALIFFPSYFILEKVFEQIDKSLLPQDILKEQRYMTKEEKEKIVNQFKEDQEETNSKIMFAVTSGSFAEGLDLPKEMLEIVIVVGLPLGMPDIYTKALIQHFDRKFKKGQMYGYIHPAMNKIVQAAGRCIRTETDKGIVVLMDNRFLWPIYAQTFPKHWKMERTFDYKTKISQFFTFE